MSHPTQLLHSTVINISAEFEFFFQGYEKKIRFNNASWKPLRTMGCDPGKCPEVLCSD